MNPGWAASRCLTTRPRRPEAARAPPDGPAERYANRIGLAGIGAAAVVGLLSRNLDTAGAAALAAVPKPLRTVREAFGCAMNRGLTTRHDALVLRPSRPADTRPG